MSLQMYEAQDALNTESSLSGTAILKRSGYSRLYSLTVATAPVSGSFSFIDSNGNRQDIVCQDHNCAKSTNGGAFSVFLSTAGGACTPTRWSFAQTNGNLYGANDCRDVIFKYNGSARTSLPSTAPLGSVIESTKDRLVIADVASNPNGVYYSQSGTYTNFVVGTNSADPYVDQSGAQGDRVSALKYALGRLFVFKTTSISSCVLGDQYTSQCFPVSSAVGTNDPLSIVEVPGAIYFRGNDRNYWALDGSGIQLVSKKISNFVKSQNSGSSGSNTQTSQSDWQAGSQFPGSSWNTSSIAGSIIPSSVSFVNNSSVSFNAGTFQSPMVATSGYVTISTAAFKINNGDFETGDLTSWTCATSGTGACSVSSSNPLEGTYSASLVAYPDEASVCVPGPSCQNLDTINIIDSNGYHLISQSVTPSASVTWVTIDLSAVSTQTLRIQLISTKTYTSTGVGTVSLLSNSFVAISSITFEFRGDGSGAGSDCYSNSLGRNSKSAFCRIDHVYVNRYFDISMTSNPYLYTSSVFNTGFSTSIGGPFTVGITSDTGSSIVFAVRDSSASSGPFSAWTSISSGTRIPLTRQYWQYESTMSIVSSTATAPRISSVGLSAATTGTLVSQCIQPPSTISAWGLISCDQSVGGNGAIVYYTTSAATCGAIPVAGAGVWTSQTNNANISVATNTAFAFRIDSSLTSSTDTAQVNSCSIYWSNGVVAPPVWGAYDSVKNAIYWTSSINNNTSNNRVLKYDLNLGQWYPFSLNANAIANIQTTTYFGDSTGGYWNQYGNSNSDNGSAINAYWKSKDFGNQSSPFLDNNYNRISLVAKNQITGNMTVTYGLSNNTSGSYTVSLSTTSGITYVHANQSLPLMSPYQFMNIKVGNNSSTPFEVDGLMLEYTSFPWKPQNP